MRAIVACLLCLTAGTSAAEVVQIRSGQHDTFSRLVLSIPEGREWTLGRVDGGYALALGRGEDSFDTSSIFDRIPANRIAAVTEENGRLRIDLACDCHADAFLWQPDRLVIDVIDGAAPEGSEFEVALDAAPPPPARPRVVLPVITEGPDRTAAVALLPGTFTRQPPTDNRVSDAERAIVESLARAASQGVFDLPSRPVPITPEAMTEDGEEPAGRLPMLTPVTDPMDGVPMPLDGPGSDDGPGLLMRTGIERNSDGIPGLATDDGHCLPDEMLSIDIWGDDRDFSTQIADHRRILTGEFDVYPDGTIENLAKTYIYFGFGEEARQALALDGQRSQERLVLDALTRAIDDRPQTSGILADQIDCSGFSVMWAALARGDLDGSTEDGRNAAIMAFRLLPDPLRGFLGARLAQIFLDAGDPTTADIVLNAAQRLETGSTVEADLTGAAVVETTEGPGPAIEALETMAEGNTRMTSDGVVRLIDLLLREGRDVDPAIIDLASAMRFEAGQSPAASELAIAEIRALTAANDFASALAIAADPDVPFADEDRGAQYSNIAIALSGREEAPDFLTFAFGDLPVGLSGDAENAVAARLLAVGFPDRAAAILSGPTVQGAMAERRYLRGQAAADMGDLAAVEDALAGLTDPRAAGIRASALAGAGDFQSALAQELQQPEAAANPEDAWRAGAWTLLETGQDPLLQTASRAILTEPELASLPPTLEARQQLLREAEATRTMTEDLLGRFGLDENP